LKFLRKLTSGINKDEFEREVEKNEIKEIEGKRRKYLNRKE
jgi:hypothetical protein